jgi:hypothetical protein
MHFVFPHRIARVSYLVRNVALAVVAVFIGLDENGDVGPGGVVALLLLVAYWSMFVVAPLCRDSGMSPWFALLLFVPGVNLFLSGYLTWKSSFPTSEGLDFSPAQPAADELGLAVAGTETKSEALRQLEAQRDDGAITEQDFVRRKARLGQNG